MNKIFQQNCYTFIYLYKDIFKFLHTLLQSLTLPFEVNKVDLLMCFQSLIEQVIQVLKQ